MHGTTNCIHPFTVHSTSQSWGRSKNIWLNINVYMWARFTSTDFSSQAWHATGVKSCSCKGQSMHWTIIRCRYTNIAANSLWQISVGYKCLKPEVAWGPSESIYTLSRESCLFMRHSEFEARHPPIQPYIPETQNMEDCTRYWASFAKWVRVALALATVQWKNYACAYCVYHPIVTTLLNTIEFRRWKILQAYSLCIPSSAHISVRKTRYNATGLTDVTRVLTCLELI